MGTMEKMPLGPGNPVGFMVYRPAGYERSRTSYPAIVYLHGFGESGHGDALDLNVLVSAGLPRLVSTGQLPPSARGFVILAPQSSGPVDDPAVLHRWLATALPRYRVDRDRLYLTGISMGGQGVFDYLDTYGDANEFAAMVPISGAFVARPVPDGVPSCERMAHTPLWAFHGDSDDVVPVQNSINVVANVDAHCRPPERLRLTIYLDSFHNVWDRTYDLSGRTDNPTEPEWDPYDSDIYRWLLDHRRHDRPHP